MTMIRHFHNPEEVLVMKRWFTLACLSAWLPMHADAARPLQTDDAGVVAAGSCEVEGARNRERLAGERSRETGVALACGIGWDSQLGAGYARTRSGDGRASHPSGGGSGVVRRVSAPGHRRCDATYGGAGRRHARACARRRP